MPNVSDDGLAELAFQTGKATREQIADARELVAGMGELGVKRDVLGALVDRQVITAGQAEEIRKLASVVAGSASPLIGKPIEVGRAEAGAEPPAGIVFDGDDAAGQADAVEKAEEIEEAEEIEKAEEIETAEPAGEETSLAATAGPAGAGAARAAGEAGQAPATGLAARVCHLHPDRPAFVSCKRCGKPMCADCTVRTEKGVFCSQSCMVEASREADRAYRRPGAGSASPVRLIVSVGALAVAGLLAYVFLVPSRGLKRARALRDGAAANEKAGRLDEALESALKLTSIESTDSKARALAEEGGKQAAALKTKLGLASLKRLRQAVAAIDRTLEPADIGEYAARAKDLDAVAAKYCDVEEVRDAVEELRELIDAGATATGRALEAAKRKAGADRAGAQLRSLRAGVEPSMRTLRFAEAREVVEAERRKAGEQPHPALAAGLEELDEEIAKAAKAAKAAEAAEGAYLKDVEKAKSLVRIGKFAVARRTYQGVIDGCGIERVVAMARTALKSVDAAERAAGEARARAQVERARKEAAKARAMMASFEYYQAVMVLKQAGRSFTSPAAKDEAARWHEIAEREYDVMRKIIQLVDTRPVDRGKLARRGGRGPALAGKEKGKLFKADERGYSVRLEARGGGSTVLENAWGKLPADELCRLAKLAVGGEPEALLNLALFCSGRGRPDQAGAAISALRREGSAKSGELLMLWNARYSVRLAEASRAPAVPAPDASKVAVAPKAPPEAEAEAVPEEEKKPVPKTIEEPCYFCHGSGVIKQLGCVKCKATGYIGVGMCGECGGTGKSRYVCPGCRGTGNVISERKAYKCRSCAGKGHPPCPACRGRGTTRRPNPEAVDGATKECPLCQGAGFDQRTFKCTRCGGGGMVEVKDLTKSVKWVRMVTCATCGGNGSCPPLCRYCSGRGYVRPPGVGVSGPVRALCPKCFGTAYQLSRCRGCGGRGYVRVGK